VEDFNKEKDYDLFYLLEADENNTHGSQILTFDKSGFYTVQEQGGKVLRKKEKPEISALSHGETACTILCYVCASRLTVLDAK